ncbi:MAG: argininosuccinate lyase, partial [Ruminococcus sp.]|nr:argininosuccinate lyase [Ruminococcus sp.]
MAKMWAGRTSGETSKIADDFNSSIRFDCKMYEQDIKGSIAHAMMLSKQNIISKSDAETLIEALGGI